MVVEVHDGRDMRITDGNFDVESLTVADRQPPVGSSKGARSKVHCGDETAVVRHVPDDGHLLCGRLRPELFECPEHLVGWAV